MLKLTKKGQASSTFQLLIAAVVALAILGVLLNILGVIPGPNKDPTYATKSLLGTQINDTGAESCTDSVTFSRSKSTLSAEGITGNSGLDPEQIYFDNPEGISNFKYGGANEDNRQLLKYNYTTSKRVIMCIICSADKEKLKQAIEANKKTGDNFIENESNLSDGEIVCVVYPRKTSTS